MINAFIQTDNTTVNRQTKVWYHNQSKTGCVVCQYQDSLLHYIDVIMTTMASQITSLTVVYSTAYSDADQRKHQSSASLAFVWGIHRDRWIPRTKGQLRGKCFHLMTSSSNLGLTLIPSWMGNHIPCKNWHKIIYPFPSFNGATEADGIWAVAVCCFRDEYALTWCILSLLETSSIQIDNWWFYSDSPHHRDSSHKG